MTLLSAAVLSAALIAPAEAIDLKHNFKEGKKAHYEFVIAGEQGGSEVELFAAWTQTVGKKGKSGRISMSITEGTHSVWAGGQEVEGEDGIELTMSLDKYGMPDSFHTEGNDIYFQAGQMLQYLPSREVNVGSEFKIKWESGGAEFVGAGTLEGLVKLEGKDLIKIHYDVDMTPADDSPATLIFDTWFNPKTMQAVKSEGEIDMDQGAFEIELTLKTKKK
jgi:hypothetical protein